MIKRNGFVIFENEEEWNKMYNEDWDRLDGCAFSGGKPASFPIAYQRFGSWDPRCCDDLAIVPLEKAKVEIQKYCEEYIENLKNIIDKLHRL